VPGQIDGHFLLNAPGPRLHHADAIGKKGEQLVPGYKYLVVYKDMYTVWGGELDWFYGSRGVYTFSNELFNSYQYFHKDRDEDGFGQGEAYEFDKSLLFGDAVVN